MQFLWYFVFLYESSDDMLCAHFVVLLFFYLFCITWYVFLFGFAISLFVFILYCLICLSYPYYVSSLSPLTIQLFSHVVIWAFTNANYWHLKYCFVLNCKLLLIITATAVLKNFLKQNVNVYMIMTNIMLNNISN